MPNVPTLRPGLRVLFVLAVVLSAFFATAPAVAVQPDEMLSDARLEARARVLSRELRCMVCQNQSIDDLDAPLARDIRLLVRERLKAGDSDTQIIDFLVARYGQFVLLRPRFEWSTALLWLTPLLAFAIGAIATLLAWRARRGRGTDVEMAAAEGLTAAEQQALSRIVSETDSPR